MVPALGTTEACAVAAIVRQASVSGGLGRATPPRGARGAEPARIHDSDLLSTTIARIILPMIR
jgi:hypothetical protein